MVSVRSAIVSAILLFVMAIGFSIINMTKTPDSGGFNNDSFGTRGRGFRALYETFDELDIAVQRELAPPGAKSFPEGTYVILEPSPIMAGTEPSYLQNLRAWVEEGGRIVIAPSVARDFSIRMQLKQLNSPLPTVLESLGLNGIQLVEQFTDVPGHNEGERRSERDGKSAEEVVGDLFESLNELSPTLRAIDVDVTGDFGIINSTVQTLTVPAANLMTLVCPEAPDGAVTCTFTSEEPQMVAARFKRGRGEIIVVSDPILFTNRLMAKSDNSLLATYVMTPDGAPVTFDEFYHGLGVRGNPLYLLTQPSYAITFFAILLALGLWVWRYAIFPGPPLPDDTIQRRDIGEYIQAMARFFTQGSAGHNRLLQEVRNGVLRQISVQAGLPPDTGDVERISDVVAKKDTERSNMILEATRFVDDALASGKKLSEKHTLEAMRRMSACL